jgi:hypothetical protein
MTWAPDRAGWGGISAWTVPNGREQAPVVRRRSLSCAAPVSAGCGSFS